MKKNKGFTLVEVIVILVILAILAAVLIPSLTTYIDKAKEKQITGNARAALVATQAMASEMYGLDITPGDLENVDFASDDAPTTNAYPKIDPSELYPTAVIDCCEPVEETVGGATKVTGYDTDEEADPEDEMLYIINLAQLTEVEEAYITAKFGDLKEAANITEFSYSQKIGQVYYTALHLANGSWTVTKASNPPA